MRGKWEIESCEGVGGLQEGGGRQGGGEGREERVPLR